MNVLFADIETVTDTERLPLFEADLVNKAHRDLDYAGAGKPGGWAGDPGADAILLAEKVSLLGSTTAEWLKIVGMNLGFDESAPRSGWVGEARDGGDPLTEVDLLQAFWSSAKQAKHVVGFNILRFDIPAILVRSALLGVEPSVPFHADKPWTDHCIDLLARRWPYKAGAQFQSLKALRRILALPIPAGYEDVLEMNGGDVGALWAAGEFEKCNRYGCLDIETARKLARHWQGYWFPVIMER